MAHNRTFARRQDDIAAMMEDITFEEDEQGIPVFEIPDDDEDNDADCFRELSDHERSAFVARFERSTTSPSCSDLTVVNSLGITIGPDICVELKDHNFFYVHKVSSTNPMTMRGNLLRRTRKFKGMLPKKCNEVAVKYQAINGQHDGAGGPQLYECLVSVPISHAIATRQLIFTNRKFPELSFREHDINLYNTLADIQEHAVLVCRSKHIEYVQPQTGKVVTNVILHLNESECSPNAGISSVQQKRGFRGVSGASVQAHKKRATQDVDFVVIDKAEFEFNQKKNSYTYADVCTGAGGMALGAIMAGLLAVFFLDHWKDACETLAANFGNVHILRHDIFDLATNTILGFIPRLVDILHISFPCQPHSPAHTTPGRNDERNIAAGYSVIPLLEQHKPRILTMGMYRHRPTS